MWKRSEIGSFDPTSLINKPRIIVVRLQTRAGAVLHAVTLFNGYIFDANSEYPMPVLWDNLDSCSGGEGTRCIEAYEFVRKQRRQG